MVKQVKGNNAINVKHVKQPTFWIISIMLMKKILTKKLFYLPKKA